MKLIIQIPCYNEEEILPQTLKALPRTVAGFDSVEWLIVDDGSTDRTVEVARAHGVHHVVSLPRHSGLATAFIAGLHACVHRGANVIINTDADNQYDTNDIPKLVAPLLGSKPVDIAVGARPIWNIRDFSPLKKVLQKLGSMIVRWISHTVVEDAPSGFRAFTREAALRLNVYSRYTYTLETLIQAGHMNLSVVSVPIRVNPSTRPSRLVKSMSGYLRHSVGTITRIAVLYAPFRFFLHIGVVVFLAGAVVGLRYIYFIVIGDSSGHVQSLIFSSILIGIGFQTILTAFLAYLVSVNRRLLEEIRYRQLQQDNHRNQ